MVMNLHMSTTEATVGKLLASESACGTTPTAQAAAQAPPRTWIGPAGSGPFVDVRELWHFRELVYFLAGRDIKVRYKQTILGAAWAVLQPAMMMVVFTLFFSKMSGVSSG